MPPAPPKKKKQNSADRYSAVMKEIQKGTIAPVYFLTGEEPFFIDRIAEHFRTELLDESQQEFDQEVLYGEDVSAPQIKASAGQFPMTGEQRLVIVKEAQNMKDLDELENYLQSPTPSSVLVICHKKKADGRKKLFKTASKAENVVYFESEPMREWQLPDWLEGFFKEKGYGIDPKACQLLVEHLGADLRKIVNESEKLMLLLPEGSTIDMEAIETNVGISKDFNIFELQDALASRDHYKANRIALQFAADPKDHPLVKELFGLYFFFSKVLALKWMEQKGKSKGMDKKELAGQLKVNPFFLEQYQRAAQNYSGKELLNVISLLRDYDMKSKGVGNVSATDGELTTELVRRVLR